MCVFESCLPIARPSSFCTLELTPTILYNPCSSIPAARAGRGGEQEQERRGGEEKRRRGEDEEMRRGEDEEMRRGEE